MDRVASYLICAVIVAAALRCAPAPVEATRNAPVPSEPVAQPAPADPLDELGSALDQLNDEAPPPAPVTTTAPLFDGLAEMKPPPERRGEPTLWTLQAEVDALRAEVQSLHESLDYFIGGVADGLAEENARLRAELSRLYALLPEDQRPLLVDDFAYYATSEMPVEAGGPVAYEIVKEWGRTAEEAAQLGDSVSSLRGLILVVGAEVGDAELADFGRMLRSENDGFDNVRIDVFDDMAAAEAYATRNALDSSHHILNVTKHLASGRDTVTLIRNGAFIDVPQ